MRCKFLILIFLFLSADMMAQIPNRTWSTYHGGSDEDSFRDMAIDPLGNVYVVGSTSSTNAIATAGSYQSSIAGGSDVYLVKYDNDGNIIWATYFGGVGDDFGQSIDLDASGNIFITGLTFSNNGITTVGTHQTTNNGNGDTFVAKFTNNGVRIWGSYLGGSNFDFANDIEVDIAGNPIIIGWTNSANNISTIGSFQDTYRGQDDVLFAKFDTNGQLLWSSYFGDTEFDTGLQVESDFNGNIIISGWTSSTNNIATTGAFQTIYGGNTADAFVAVFTSSGNRLWSTYYGGSGNDYGDALLVNGDIYLSGSTSSPNNIASPAAFQPNLGIGYDAFLTKFTITGTRLWSTYFGGNGDDTAFRLRESSNGGIYMVGHTTSSNVMATPGAFQQTKSGGQDVFLSRFQFNGTHSWSTYYGGNSNDFGYGLVLDANNDIFINGTTEGSTNLSTSGAPQTAFGGGTKDGFVTKFSPCTDPILNFKNSGFSCSPVNYIFEFELIGQAPFTIYYNIDGVPQIPWTTNNQNFFPIVNANLWTKIIQIDSVKSGLCKGTINSVWGFVQVRDSIRSTTPIITCDQATSTYTITVNLSGGAFGGFSSVGTNGGFINSTTNQFVSFPIPFNDPYFIQFTEVGTFSNCDTISFQGTADCIDPCPPLNITLTSNSPVCAGSTLLLLASGGNMYQWIGPNGYTSTMQNPNLNNVTTNNSGMYSVTVTDANGCTGTAIITVLVNQFVSAITSTNSPVCSGNSINLMASGGNIYQWSGPSGYTSNLQNPIINNATNLNAGTYTVTVTDGNGCTGSLSVSVIVNPTLTVSSTSNSPICIGSPINLMASGGNMYQWSGPNGYTSNLQNPIINNATNQNAGTYTVTVTDGNGCTGSLSVSVIVNPTLTVSSTSNSPICIGSPINLMASGGNMYQWSGPNGYTSNLQNPIINNATNQNAGTYTVTVTDASGCTGISSTTLIINLLPMAIITSNGPLCAGNKLNLMATGGVSYNWTGPNSFTSSLQNPMINGVIMINGGPYTVTVTDINGCTTSTATNVVIQSSPNAILSSNSPVCNGGDITFQLSGGISYLWQGPNNFTSNVQNPIISNASSANNGTYAVTVTGQNGCTTSVSTIVSVTGQLNATVSTNSPICEGDTLRLMTNGGVSYVWNGPNGFVSSLQNPIIASVNTNSSGTYILTVSDVSGCTGTRTINVDVNQKPLAVITGDTEICAGEALILQSPNVGILLWSTNDVSSSIMVNPIINTTYTLVVEMNGCRDTAFYPIIVKPKPILSINLSMATLTVGESIQLIASGAAQYEWSPPKGLSCTDCPDPIATPMETSIYCVKASLDDCPVDTCIVITVLDGCSFVFPNIFTPNGDGSNDQWCSKAQDCVVAQILSIYDRWGNLMYRSSGAEVCWDGGTTLQNNVYTFLLQIVKADGKEENLSGNITLVR